MIFTMQYTSRIITPLTRIIAFQKNVDLIYKYQN